jgi:hypothetical protein
MKRAERTIGWVLTHHSLDPASAIALAKSLDAASAIALAKNLDPTSAIAWAKNLDPASAIAWAKSLDPASAIALTKSLDPASDRASAKRLDLAEDFVAAKGRDRTLGFNLTKAREPANASAAAKLRTTRVWTEASVQLRWVKTHPMKSLFEGLAISAQPNPLLARLSQLLLQVVDVGATGLEA